MVSIVVSIIRRRACDKSNLVSIPLLPDFDFGLKSAGDTEPACEID
jgi:hypothetical protein